MRDINATIRRLKREQTEERGHAKARGQQAGEKWAREEATLRDLRAVALLRRSEPAATTITWDGLRARWPALRAVDEMNGVGQPDEDGAAAARDYPDAFSEGLLDGVERVWQAVEHQVSAG